MDSYTKGINMNEFTLDDGAVLAIPIAVLVVMALPLLIYFIILRIRNPKNKPRSGSFYDQPYRGVWTTILEVLTNLFLGGLLFLFGSLLLNVESTSSVVSGFAFMIGGLLVIVQGMTSFKKRFRMEWHEKLGTTGFMLSVLGVFVGVLLSVIFGIMTLFNRDVFWIFITMLLFGGIMFLLSAWFSYFNQYMTYYMFGPSAKGRKKVAKRELKAKSAKR